MTIGSDIINSLGAGSGINSGSIVEQLVDIEKSIGQSSIDGDRTLFETQISDYGLLRSALSVLQDSAEALMSSDSFGAKNATFTSSDALVPSSLGDTAPVGDYTFEVLAIATAQSLSTTASFSTVNDAVGKGELTFSFGEWDESVPPEAFTVDTERDAFNITIDDTNNTLTGLRDAINAADEGVQASIINDGSGYRLVITSESGATNELQITVVEDGGSPTNTDGNDLSRFAFAAGVAGANQQMQQTQSGADASLVVNGLTVTRSSNVIDDVLEGFEFSLVKADPGAIMTITIFEDKDAAETAIRDFVDAYNAFLEASAALADVDEETEENGSLYRDTTTKTILSGIRDVIASSIPGLGDDFSSLAAVGIRTNLDNSLVIAEDAFTTAFEDGYDLVKSLFAPQTSTSDAGVVVSKYGDDSVAGSYEVVITQDAAKGQLIGATADSATFLASLANVATTATDYDFTVVVDGTESGTISLTPGTYTNDELAAHIQSQINNDETLAAVRADVDVIWDIDHFEITSKTYGASTNVAVTDVGISTGILGLSTGTPTSGSDVAGTFDGVAGFGVGNVLLAALNTDPYGITLLVDPGVTSATVVFSGGFGRELSGLLEGFLESSGILDNRELNLGDSLEGLDEDQERLDRRIEAYSARLDAQFLAMELIVSSLSSTSDYLDTILGTLPYTSENN